MYALSLCFEASQTSAGSCAVLVDAKNEKGAEFYKKYGFHSFDEKPLCLYVSMRELEIAMPADS
jgi:hypothetical protein